ncbi:hypothetical protein B296_00029674 [Ensete ventricosum]|uniref:beta-carotene 3-hydroxylase n=1 Tax=Ensete ventricosum TaxID=4639 RepID=A0A426ZTN9_ENSVE|nr:hypothetical protein B296_00029674 [Ensete ventricosum]
MAAAATALISCFFARDLSLPPRAAGDCSLHFRSLPVCPPLGRASALQPWLRRPAAVCFVLNEVSKEQKKKAGYAWMEDASEGEEEEGEMEGTEEIRISWNHRTEDRAARKQEERRTYLIAAVMSSLGFTSMAIAAVYYRFSWQMEVGGCPASRLFNPAKWSVFFT